MASQDLIRLEAKRARRHEERIYVLVEEARVRCEALRDAADAGAVRDELHRLHRELGLSALHVSTHMPSTVRRSLLARVHSRCDHQLGTRRGLKRTVDRALREVKVKAASAEHIQLTRLHLLRAMEFLCPTPTPRPSFISVLRLRPQA
jgi:N-formylglutamate amidohydrolase